MISMNLSSCFQARPNAPDRAERFANCPEAPAVFSPCGSGSSTAGVRDAIFYRPIVSRAWKANSRRIEARPTCKRRGMIPTPGVKRTSMASDTMSQKDSRDVRHAAPHGSRSCGSAPTRRSRTSAS